MATKTLTITEEAYRTLAGRKLNDESFSEEIQRIFSKRKIKTLRDFFGILSDKEGGDMLKDLERIHAAEIKHLRKRIQ